MKKIQFSTVLLEVTKPSFIAGSTSFLVMLIVYAFGNPKFFNVIFLYWHHIPEVTFFYFVGVWLREIKRSFAFVLYVYVGTVILTPLTLGSFSFLKWFFLGIMGAILVSPLVGGYVIQKNIEKKRR